MRPPSEPKYAQGPQISNSDAVLAVLDSSKCGVSKVRYTELLSITGNHNQGGKSSGVIAEAFAFSVQHSYSKLHDIQIKTQSLLLEQPL